MCFVFVLTKVNNQRQWVHDKLHSYSKQPGFKVFLAPEEPNIGGRYCPYRKGHYVVVRFFFPWLWNILP